MLRLHLFEFSDLDWTPRVLRNAETAYLATAYRLLRPLTRCCAEMVATLFEPGEEPQILDLCSGSGGPIPLILEELERLGYHARATLTDLYPDRASEPRANIVWVTDPVDATCVPAALPGVRTMFAGLHHFRPDGARNILKDAFDKRRPICIVEPGPRTLASAVSMLFVPLAVLGVMPFARPVRLSHLLFTYLVPVTPFIVMWDGFVSLLRYYSPAQLEILLQDLSAPDYKWEIGRKKVRGVVGGVPYLIGRPASPGVARSSS